MVCFGSGFSSFSFFATDLASVLYTCIFYVRMLASACDIASGDLLPFSRPGLIKVCDLKFL